MAWVRKRGPLEADILAMRASALESNAIGAGAALGCSYTNSTEYEAELIAERRAAGAYTAKHNPWKGRIVILAAGACALMLVLLIAR